MARIKTTEAGNEARRQNGKSGGRPPAMVCVVPEDETERLEFQVKGSRVDVEDLRYSSGGLTCRYGRRTYGGQIEGPGEYKLNPVPKEESKAPAEPVENEPEEEDNQPHLRCPYWLEIDILVKRDWMKEARRYLHIYDPGGKGPTQASKVSARAYFKRCMADGGDQRQ